MTVQMVDCTKMEAFGEKMAEVLNHAALALMTSVGHRTGLFTSPHLLRFNERIQVDGEEIGDDALARLKLRVEAAAATVSKKIGEKFGATPVQARVVRDGNLITAGGVTAGIDFGLAVVAELVGRTEAEAIQLGLEYAPAPPFAAGTPDEAPSAVVAAVKERLAPTRKAREAIIARLVA